MSNNALGKDSQHTAEAKQGSGTFFRVFATVAILCLLILNIFTIIYFQSKLTYTEDDYIAIHYESETATLVSPHGLRERMERGDTDFILVDTREKNHYEREHIKGSVNIPGYSDEEKLVGLYRDLQERYPGRRIIIYCYTEVCMRGRKVGRVLSRNGIYVQELGIGFNEWKHYWKNWNYEWEWDNVHMEELIESGPDKEKVEEGGLCSDNEETFSC